MYLLALGIIFMALKWFNLTFVSDWDWWQVMIPFGLAFLWWTWADSFGYYKKGEMDKQERRKQARIKKHRDELRGKASPRR